MILKRELLIMNMVRHLNGLIKKAEQKPKIQLGIYPLIEISGTAVADIVDTCGL